MFILHCLLTQHLFASQAYPNIQHAFFVFPTVIEQAVDVCQSPTFNSLSRSLTVLLFHARVRRNARPRARDCVDWLVESGCCRGLIRC